MSFIIEVLHLTLCSIILKINTQLTMLRFEKKKKKRISTSKTKFLKFQRDKKMENFSVH